ncbi:MAG: SMC-Scp complex subunit ScpB [Verrucomicrobiota bacterium]
MIELEYIIEAMLLSADRPLSIKEIARLVQRGFSLQATPGTAASSENDPASSASQKELEQRCADILEHFKKKWENSAFLLQEVAGGWRLGTAPQFAPWVRSLFEGVERLRVPRLSQPALETLAIVAYRQPLSRAEIEAVRGVGVGGVLETLIERGVIRVAGRSETPGRPLLYETTPYFLEHFGLRGLDELPNVEELKRVKLPEPPVAQQPELIHEAEASENQN